MHSQSPSSKVLYATLLVAAAVGAMAQDQPQPAAQPPQREEPRPDELEPAVNTSAPVAPARSPDVPPAPVGKPAAAATPAAGKGRVLDRLELDTTQITGNRELPKVLYIVPWKRSDLGDLLGKPVNSLLDEVLQPVDRDVFRRENRYYRALQPQMPPAQAPAAPE